MSHALFYDKLNSAWSSQNSLLCVGIDPDPTRLPKAISSTAQSYLEFGKAIVEATAPYVCAFKPQAAHFGAAGRESELAELIKFIRQNYPDHVVILDAKRGDVGSTAELYAVEAYERYNADAVTLNPYLGAESIRPYLQYTDRGVVVLCRTSNPDSDWLQNQSVPPIYQQVASQVQKWNSNQQCMLVTGATYPQELAEIRKIVGKMPLLVPGIGAQGGDLEAVLKVGLDVNGRGLVISSSRSIIYASADNDFATKAGEAAQQQCNEINEIRLNICDK